MRSYLVFTLTAALGAMGGPAGHERRGTDTWPARSAILGLIAAAMGIRRDGDFSQLDALGLAVAVFDQGDHLRDFHTAQTVPSANSKHPQSRPAALAEAGLKLNTVLSWRDYRCNPLYGVAIWGQGLSEIETALKTPVFTLYLGRKSCPLASPLWPRIISCESLEAAFEHITLPDWHTGAEASLIASDIDGLAGGHIQTRHDFPIDRHKWHFAARSERIVPACIKPGAPQ